MRKEREMNDLNNLKNTYGDCIERQKQVIAINRAKLNMAVKNRNFEEMRRLRRVLNVLYDEQTELEYLYKCLGKYVG